MQIASETAATEFSCYHKIQASAQLACTNKKLPKNPEWSKTCLPTITKQPDLQSVTGSVMSSQIYNIVATCTCYSSDRSEVSLPSFQLYIAYTALCSNTKISFVCMFSYNRVFCCGANGLYCQLVIIWHNSKIMSCVTNGFNLLYYVTNNALLFLSNNPNIGHQLLKPAHTP